MEEVKGKLKKMDKKINGMLMEKLRIEIRGILKKSLAM